jgi:hypothetical protein
MAISAFEIFAWRRQLASAKRRGLNRAGFNYANSGGQHLQVSCGSGCVKGRGVENRWSMLSVSTLGGAAVLLGYLVLLIHSALRGGSPRG